jgi:hypothetical protein
MRHYRIYIGGYGGEQCFGAITKEQYEFWKDLEEHHLISHMMDPYEEDDDNPVFDSEDPRWIGEFYENDGIMHLNAASFDSAYISVDELEGTEWNSGIVKEVIENEDWSSLYDKYEEQGIEDNMTHDWINFKKAHPEVKYVFYGASIDKGGFGDYIISIDEEFDFMKCKWCSTETPNGEDFIELIGYGDLDVDNMGGDTNGKGMAAGVWELGEHD